MKFSKTTYITKFLSVVSVLLITMTSCQKSPINGDLDGQWQVMSVEPEPSYTEPGYDTRLYYCFSLHVCQLSIPGLVWISGTLEYSPGHVTIYFPKDLTSQEKRILMQYGINSNTVNFL